MKKFIVYGFILREETIESEEPRVIAQCDTCPLAEGCMIAACGSGVWESVFIKEQEVVDED